MDPSRRRRDDEGQVRYQESDQGRCQVAPGACDGRSPGAGQRAGAGKVIADQPGEDERQDRPRCLLAGHREPERDRTEVGAPVATVKAVPAVGGDHQQRHEDHVGEADRRQAHPGAGAAQNQCSGTQRPRQQLEHKEHRQRPAEYLQARGQVKRPAEHQERHVDQEREGGVGQRGDAVACQRVRVSAR